MINLNNGGVSPAPKTVQDAMKRYYDLCNEAPSYYMWRFNSSELYKKIWLSWPDADAEEIAINRNSSEGLETVIFGLPLKAGDEVGGSQTGLSQYDKCLQAKRTKGQIKSFDKSLNCPVKSKLFSSAICKCISAKTKVVHITHVINWNSQDAIQEDCTGSP